MERLLQALIQRVKKYYLCMIKKTRESRGKQKRTFFDNIKHEETIEL